MTRAASMDERAPAGAGSPIRLARPEMALTVYLRVAAQVLGLAMPLSMMLVVDRVVNQGAVDTLVALVAGVTLLTVFQYLFLWAQARHNIGLVEALSAPERRHLYGALLGSSEAAALTGAGWEALQAVQDDARFCAETRPQWLADLVFVALLVFCMALFDPLLLGVSAGFVPLYLLVEVRSERRANALATEAGGLRHAVTSGFLETIAASGLVRSLQIADRLLARWSATDARLAAVRARAALERRRAALSVEFLQRLSVILVMLLGVQTVISGGMTLGQYIAFNLLSLQLAQPILRLAGYHRAVSDRRLRSDGSRGVLNRCEASRWPRGGGVVPQRRDGVSLQVRGLTADCPDAPAPVSFSLLRGGRIGLIGPSGIGKSTLLMTLAGHRPPKSGAVHLNGVRLDRIDAKSLCSLIRLVPQEPVLLTASVAENIGLGAQAPTPEEIVAAATVCGVTSMVGAWPASFDTLVGPGGKVLSGGEQQRIALARAIVGRPQVLLLDEATSSLDSDAESLLLANLSRFLPDCAWVVVSHRDSALRGIDRVLRLDRGQGRRPPALSSV